MGLLIQHIKRCIWDKEFRSIGSKRGQGGCFSDSHKRYINFRKENTNYDIRKNYEVKGRSERKRNDEEIQKNIKDIFYGYDESNSYNVLLDKKYFTCLFFEYVLLNV